MQMKKEKLSLSARVPLLSVLTLVHTTDREFPYLALLASGGHTQLVLARGVANYDVLGGYGCVYVFTCIFALGVVYALCV